MTRSDYRDGVIRVQQNKTGEKLAIPASVALKDILDPWIVAHEHIMLVTSGAGAAFKIDHFRHCMRAAYQKAGLDTTTHGLRYTAATVLKEIGLGWEDIASITGHRTSDMVKKYTAQKRRAARAIAKLDENTKSTKV